MFTKNGKLTLKKLKKKLTQKMNVKKIEMFGKFELKTAQKSKARRKTNCQKCQKMQK